MADPGETSSSRTKRNTTANRPNRDAVTGRPTRPSVGDGAELGIDGLTEVSIVGTGGSSTVYRARQEALDRTVAVKVVHAAWSIQTRERFEHEREVMGRLSGHVAIVPIFETGITTRGEPYLLMPFYRRGSLFRLVKDRGPLPWREAAFIVEALADALADCHRAGIVHRDVKPANVLLTDHLQPRLGDFGIALSAGMNAAGGGVAYTPSYSPPEAFEAGVAKPTVDVYSLGATMWALLAGRAPFTEPGGTVDAAEVIERSSRNPIGPPSAATPAPIVDLLLRATAKDPSGRPADAGVFAAELRRAVRLSEHGEDRRSSPSVGRWEPVGAVVPVTLIAAGMVLLLGGLAMVMWW